MAIDDNGWAVGPVAPLNFAEAWSLFSPEPEARIDAARWGHQAAAFFGAEVTLISEKRYPGGAAPLADEATLQISPLRGNSQYRAAAGDFTQPTRVEIVTMPLDRARAVLEAAREGVRAIGGAGFDVLLTRARRLWQVSDRPLNDGDPRAPLLLAGVMASVLLAPIVPPGGGVIFGVKGARDRLAQRGWR
jgi:hypothetical protein